MVQSYILQKCSIACLGFCTRHSSEAQTAQVLLDSWSLKFLAGMLIIYIVLIKLAVWTFLTTYVFSAKTIIYFLLRKDIDNTVVADVHLEDVQQEVAAIPESEKKHELGKP